MEMTSLLNKVTGEEVLMHFYYLRRRLVNKDIVTRCHAVCVSAEPRRRYCTPLRVLLVSFQKL